jgi:membrane protein implicated in regulation of membrane protease activity
MTLEAGYWIALGVGVGFLVLSIVLGDVFDFLDFLDFDLGDGFAATPVFFTAIAAFGGGGLLGLNSFGLGTGASILAGLVAAVAAGGLAAAFFAMLAKQQMTESFSVSQLVGARGRCTLAIHPGREGRVSIQHQNMTRSFTATSEEEIATSEPVVVLDAVGGSLTVGKAETVASEPQ